MSDKIKLNLTIANNVRIARENKGLTREGLAAEASLSRKYIDNVESNIFENVSLGVMKRICKALDVTFASLLVESYEVESKHSEEPKLQESEVVEILTKDLSNISCYNPIVIMVKMIAEDSLPKITDLMMNCPVLSDNRKMETSFYKFQDSYNIETFESTRELIISLTSIEWINLIKYVLKEKFKEDEIIRLVFSNILFALERTGDNIFTRSIPEIGDPFKKNFPYLYEYIITEKGELESRLIPYLLIDGMVYINDMYFKVHSLINFCIIDYLLKRYDELIPGEGFTMFSPLSERASDELDRALCKLKRKLLVEESEHINEKIQELKASITEARNDISICETNIATLGEEIEKLNQILGGE